MPKSEGQDKDKVISSLGIKKHIQSHPLLIWGLVLKNKGHQRQGYECSSAGVGVLRIEKQKLKEEESFHLWFGIHQSVTPENALRKISMKTICSHMMILVKIHVTYKMKLLCLCVNRTHKSLRIHPIKLEHNVHKHRNISHITKIIMSQYLNEILYNT